MYEYFQMIDYIIVYTCMYMYKYIVEVTVIKTSPILSSSIILLCIKQIICITFERLCISSWNIGASSLNWKNSYDLLSEPKNLNLIYIGFCTLFMPNEKRKSLEWNVLTND